MRRRLPPQAPNLQCRYTQSEGFFKKPIGDLIKYLPEDMRTKLAKKAKDDPKDFAKEIFINLVDDDSPDAEQQLPRYDDCIPKDYKGIWPRQPQYARQRRGRGGYYNAPALPDDDGPDFPRLNPLSDIYRLIPEVSYPLNEWARSVKTFLYIKCKSMGIQLNSPAATGYFFSITAKQIGAKSDAKTVTITKSNRRFGTQKAHRSR